MKNDKSLRLLREAIRRIISEEASKEKLGFRQTKYHDALIGVAYKINAVEEALADYTWDEDKSAVKDNFEKALEDAIVGMILIAPSSGPCAGAWEVKHSAGPGYGKLVYSMGYHMAPNGRLIADRSSLSSDAQDAWLKVRKKSEGIPLDDMYAPDDEKKTSDESDDCELWRVSSTGKKGKATTSTGVADEKTADAVNRAYSMGDGGFNFKAMQKASDSFLADLSLDESFLDDTFVECGRGFFGHHYKS